MTNNPLEHRPDDLRIALRTEEIFAQQKDSLRMSINKLLGCLLAFEWILAVVLALILSPRTWSGDVSSAHLHLYAAAIMGGILTLLPCLMIVKQPLKPLTRYTVAIAQMLMSALLIHVTGGRIETHFHVFGSLAFLAFYLDWRVLLLAAGVVAMDHMIRGHFWPYSVYGVATASNWRWIEHAVWVSFIETALLIAIFRVREVLLNFCLQQAQLEVNYQRGEQIIENRTEQLEESRDSLRKQREILQAVLENIPYAVFWKDCNSVYVGCNKTMAAIAGLNSPEEIVGKTDFDLPWTPEQAAHFRECDRLVISSGVAMPNIEETQRRPNGTCATLITSKVPLLDQYQNVIGVLGMFTDVTERRTLEMQLAEAQKLESIGQLAVGVAHEIDTPVQRISDNLEYLSEGIGALLEVAGTLDGSLNDDGEPVSSGEQQRKSSHQKNEPPFNRKKKQISTAIAETREGIHHVSDIVRALKEISQPGTREQVPIDLNSAIHSMVTITRNHWKEVADVELDLDPHLPKTTCLPAEIYQVLMNVLINATDAVAEKFDTSRGEKGRVTIRTFSDQRHVFIAVSDNGPGIHAEIRERIFDPFFTTKTGGKGTGQGLTICYNVIVQQHHGRLTVDSHPGEGTTLTISLPRIFPDDPRQGLPGFDGGEADSALFLSEPIDSTP